MLNPVISASSYPIVVEFPHYALVWYSVKRFGKVQNDEVMLVLLVKTLPVVRVLVSTVVFQSSFLL